MIPGVATFHPRSSWVDPAYPITGPAVDINDITTAVIHYTGADDLIDGDPGEHAEDLPAYFRSMQRHYVNVRRYSLGYWFGVDWLGGVWQVRGWSFRSAANAGHNTYTCPILVLVDGDDMATPEAVRSVQAIIAEGERLSGNRWSIRGHGDIGATRCPGVGLSAQVRAGVFTPQPPPPPPVNEEEPEMLLVKVDRGGGAWTGLAYTGAHLAHVTTPAAWAIPVAGGATVVDVADGPQVDDLIRSAQTTTACPPEWVNTSRGAVWQSQRG